MEAKTVYYENPGRENTEETLAIAKKRAAESGIKTVVVASTTGYTAVKAVEILKDLRVVIVTHSTGFKEPNTQEFTEENRRIVQASGAPMLTAAHAFGGLNRSMRQSSIPETPTTYIIGDIITKTLRILGEGVKVACEIATMAADAGLVRTDEDIISIAGTGAGNAGRGADVALVVRPSCAHLFFETKIREVLCKPHF